MTHPNTVHTILKRADAGVAVDDIAYEFGMTSPEVIAILASDEAQTLKLIAAAYLRLDGLQAPELWAECASLEHHIHDLETQHSSREYAQEVITYDSKRPRGRQIIAGELDARVAELTSVGWTIEGSRSDNNGGVKLRYSRPKNVTLRHNYLWTERAPGMRKA